MNRVFFILAIGWFLCAELSGQAPQSTPSSTTPRQVQQRQSASFDLTEYGITFQADSRLITMMAALEAAGFDPTPPGREISNFRAQVSKDLADLDPDLRERLRSFYHRHRLPPPATAADQASRYISLALTLGQPPTLDAPERSLDLPAGLLEVLDFAPLAREFYRRSGMEDRLVTYTRAYQAEGDRLRQPTAEMVRQVLTYLHTRPITIATERVLVTAPTSGKKKKAPQRYTLRDHERHFSILPDLLAPTGAINFRIIGDEYYAIVPPGIDPTSSELRRAYLQFVIDPLILRFNREISERREPIKQIIAAREKEGAQITPDVFLVVARSLVAAADARFEEVRRTDAITAEARTKIERAVNSSSRAAIAEEMQRSLRSVQDATTARMADEYERGSVLVFYFADQLKGIESSGFDIANFFPDMLAALDPAKEIGRPTEYTEARNRFLAERQARASQAEADLPVYSEGAAAKAAGLVRKLSEVEELLRLKDYNNAEVRLKELFADYPGESRVFFALAQTANLAAQDATDEKVQSERLRKALTNYRLAVEASSTDTDRALISRAHEAMGRIHAFMENTAEALKEFEQAIKVGEVAGGAYREAVAGKRRLEQP
ncbi:MAG TPA: hypothetical protein VJ023_05710 [Pyrinomonadaceae bacterium]|nr:hypothetical protein [Pyrinomonadaceae bacterium]